MKFHADLHQDRELSVPLAFAHFLPWYTLRGADFPLHQEDARTVPVLPPVEDLRHWNDARAGYRRSHLHMPAIGVYDSRDPRVIEWQIATALDHGIQGFILNWYGTNSVENVIALHWLRGLERWNVTHPDRPFLYLLSIDSQAQVSTEGRQPVSMEEDFRYIRQHLIRTAYLHRDSRPVIAIFPYEDNCSAWRSAADAVFGDGSVDLIWLNGCPGQGENAAYPWVQPDDSAMEPRGVYRWSDPDNTGDRWLRDFYRRANKTSRGVEYIMAGVWPGFDDQLVTWAWHPSGEAANTRPRVMCRETSRGNTLDLTWQCYLDYLTSWSRQLPGAKLPAPLVQIVTWNDYAEASTVEPTRDYGTAPLELCRRRIEEARGICRGGL